jgi:FkbM family methyltransferase
MSTGRLDLPRWAFLRRWRYRWWDWRLRRLHLGWPLASGHRVEIASRADWCVFNDLFVEGEYDRAIQDTVANLGGTQRATVVDLGANVGFFTLRFLDRWQRAGRPGVGLHLILIEGCAATFAELQRRSATWSDVGVQLTLLHGLAGEKHGTAQVVTDVSHLGTHVAATSPGAGVAYLDLDHVVPAGPVALLKCDIEGSEHALLRNYPLLLSRTERAVFEFHHWIKPAAESIAEVQAHGFAAPVCLREAPDYSTHYFGRTPASASSNRAR